MYKREYNFEVSNISDYINACLEIKNEFIDEIVVYRGETQDFGKTSCIPGLFRKDYLKNNPLFEKNLLDEMTANGIAKGNSYLEKAINAQHDGFPSRLLDVTYNSLIGLHFAVTPYYKYSETCDDNKDGVVFVYHFENSFCATGDGISKNYDKILKKDSDWYKDSYLFSRNYKFIDHMKINERIKAQDGAFILFQGDTPHQIPEYFYKTIRIPYRFKKEFRKCIKNLFDIDNSTIYPEAYNLVQKISEKSLTVKEVEFSIISELDFSLKALDKHLDEKISIITNSNIKQDELIRNIEKELLLYAKAFKSFYINTSNKYKTTLDDFISDYNEIVEKYFSYIEEHKKEDIEINEKRRFLLKDVYKKD